MKQGRSLPEVLTELQRQNAAKHDYIAPAQALSLSEDGENIILDHIDASSSAQFGVTDLFHRQIGAALNIPAKYYDMMRSQKPQLLSQNVNSWLADRDQSYMIRSMDYGSGQVARAFLSDRYRRIDNLEVATAVLPLFAGKEEMEVVSCEVSPSILFIKRVHHKLELAVVS